MQHCGRSTPTDATQRGRSQDDGMVTAETAMVIPVLVIVLAMAIFALACVAAQLRCVDAARASARLAARGDSPAAVTAAGRQLAPRDAGIQVRTDGEHVTVEVTAEVMPLGGVLRRVPGVAVSARAVALREQTLDQP